jgi:hypothetical protein
MSQIIWVVVQVRGCKRGEAPGGILPSPPLPRREPFLLRKESGRDLDKDKVDGGYHKKEQGHEISY